MAEPMRLLGVGSRFSFLALPVAMLGVLGRLMLGGLMLGGLMLGGLMLGGLGACSSGEPGARSEGAVLATASASAEGKSGEPEQVVRQMKASPEPSTAAGAGRAQEAAAGEAVSSEARASAAGVSRATGGLAPRSSSAETITSKHLEAELNRLEAELAN
jgi:hypothetical protein